MSVTEETSKHVGSVIDALKNEPLSIALILMNMALLGFFYVLLTTVAAQREKEVGLLYQDKAATRELLAKCVVPPARQTRLPKRGALPSIDPISLVPDVRRRP
jgi:hypothetical protein